ncbi:MAG TPA: NADH-quinone oxidoreductase subunit C [Clostridia bacterium]
MLDNLVEITKDELLTEVQNMWYNGYRFVTSSCVSLAEGATDVIYHFDKAWSMKNFKLKVSKGEEIPSISNIYFCAILVENEMKELFGLNIKGIAIDYGGHMLLSDDELNSPMVRQQITIEKKEAGKS